MVDLGGSGWNVLSSATATQGGAGISTTGFSTQGWLRRADGERLRLERPEGRPPGQLDPG